MARIDNGKTIIMSRKELKEKACLLCYGFDLYNSKETELINALSDLVFETFYDSERNQYKSNVDWNFYDKQIGCIKLLYSRKDFNFDIYERIIFKIFINF